MSKNPGAASQSTAESGDMLQLESLIPLHSPVPDKKLRLDPPLTLQNMTDSFPNTAPPSVSV